MNKFPLTNLKFKKTKSSAGKRTISIFSSLEEENQAEYARLRRMTPNQRLDEFAILQERAWGPSWTKKPMKKIASWEKVNW
jgi:hypothetical protein